MNTIQNIRKFHEDLTAFRQDLHAHPELGLEEYRTAGLVAQKLRSFGIEVHEGVGKTGVVGVLRAGSGHRKIGLRADMDALPMQEENDLPYKSTIAHKMHACGHDGHTTMLLGAAQYLAQTKKFNGTVHFIFQPGEEGAGGAQAMLQDDLFTRFPCDAIFGMHNSPELEIGEFRINHGPIMAGGAFFDIAITGLGAHASRPETGIDPIVVGAQIVLALQTILSRNITAFESASLSVTRVESSSSAYNVIPHHVVLGGTVRCFSNEIMEFIKKRVTEISQGIASSHGAEAKVDFKVIFVPTVNNKEKSDFFAETAKILLGERNVKTNAKKLMGSEDFGFMLEHIEGAYGMIGNGKGFSPHHPNYNFNDEAIPYGAALYAKLVENFLT
ncbi:M20 aminoacylase family protein [Acetobacter syzygii]|uniref:M20 aminoacylase family protein n=1 Tax=Acetobacter syzygii TaxID=146476 RepID=UPI0039EB6707